MIISITCFLNIDWKNTNTFRGNEPNASVLKENIDTLLSKIFPVLQKVAENFPEKWKSILPQYKICSES